ncbi:MAG TPA: hypothetical protein VFL76_08740 [Edaphocola sp.]|nr:hypothetical protein [Edaphocola sp.]
MKDKILLAFSIVYLLGCSNNKKCGQEHYDKYFEETNSKHYGDFLLNRAQEKVVSTKNNIETVRGFDSCDPARNIYLYQRKRISSDSTILDGYFKTFYFNGSLRDSFVFVNGKQNGMSISFWPNGTIKGELFMYEGQYSGPQIKYDSTGKIKEVAFLTNDTSAWFSVRYQKSGKIDTMIGNSFRIIESNVAKNRTYELGQWIGDNFEVPTLRNIQVEVKIDLSNEKRNIYDTTITQFFNKFNTRLGFWGYKLTKNALGADKVTIYVKLIDSNTKHVIRQDSFSRSVIVHIPARI